MGDVAITRNAESQRLGGVSAESQGGERRGPPPEGKRRRRQQASPELAVALGEAVTVIYEEGPNGAPLIRVIDNEHGETVALLTPEELRALAATTGLPPGLLMRVQS